MEIPTPACQQRWEQRLQFGTGILPILTGEHCSSRASTNNHTNPNVNSLIPSNTMSLRITFGKTILSIYLQINRFPELNVILEYIPQIAEIKTKPIKVLLLYKWLKRVTSFFQLTLLAIKSEWKGTNTTVLGYRKLSMARLAFQNSKIS